MRRFLSTAILILVSAFSVRAQCVTIQDTLLTLQGYAGSASVSGSTVTRLSGQSFNSLSATFQIVIGATSFPIASITNGNVLQVTGSPASGTQSWSYTVPLGAGSTITLALGYSPLPIVQSVATVTVGSASPNVTTCLQPGSYTAAYNVVAPNGGSLSYPRYWNVPAGGPYTIATYGSSPGVETPTAPNPSFTVSLNQLAPLGPAYNVLQMNSAGTGALWGPVSLYALPNPLMASGTSFPSTPVTGQLFLGTNPTECSPSHPGEPSPCGPSGIFSYFNGGWNQLSGSNGGAYSYANHSNSGYNTLYFPPLNSQQSFQFSLTPLPAMFGGSVPSGQPIGFYIQDASDPNNTAGLTISVHADGGNSESAFEVENVGTGVGPTSIFIGENNTSAGANLSVTRIDFGFGVQPGTHYAAASVLRTDSTNTVGGFQQPLYTPNDNDNCTPGRFANDANYHYVCTATNTWKRVALSSF